MPESSVRFRLNARKVFLTYPQSGDVSHSSLQAFLLGHGSCYSCKEQHQDGTPHIHAFLDFGRKRDIRDERIFDFEGLHPNIQPVRDPGAVIKYIEKNGDVLGDRPESSAKNQKMQLTALIGESTTRAEFVDGFARICPRDYILYSERIEEFASKRFAVEAPVILRKVNEFRVPNELTEWVSRNLFPSPERPKCLILVGPTRCGKTEWSRSLGEHTYWSNYVTSERNTNARYAVIDDMEGFDRFTGRKCIFGCQKIVGLNPKYSRLQQWNWGIPTIWLWNPESVPFQCRDPNGYFRQNSTYIQIETPLF